MQDEILKRLDLIGAKLEMGAGKMWEILVHQARVEALWSLGLGVFILIAALLLCWLAFFSSRQASKETYSSGWEACAFIAGMIGGLLLIPAVANIYNARWYFMPEAWALQHLLRQVQ